LVCTYPKFIIPPDQLGIGAESMDGYYACIF
jgi:hypothetical protein